MSQENLERHVREPDATLQQYSLQLVACIDEMRFKRDHLHKQILNEMKEKENLQNDLRKLTDKLVKVNEAICDKVVTRNRLDETIKETETAFTTLAMGSENLLNFVRKVRDSLPPDSVTQESESNESEKKKKHCKKLEPSKR